MSFVALVFGVSACYRTLKRGAVQMSNTFFVYLSLLMQIFARIFSIGLYFFAVRSFMPAVPIMLSIHFAAVFVIKWSFERTRHTQGMLSWLVSVVNIFASSLVYVRIVPIEMTNAYYKNKHKSKCPNRSSHNVQQHSTFFVQSLFFLLVLIENMALACTPLFVGNPTNRAFECLGKEKLVEYLFIVIALCAGSWFFHILYYKYMGHPWADINGPEVDKDSLKFYFHFCGTERLFRWTYGDSSRGPDTDPGAAADGEASCCLNSNKTCNLTCKKLDDCDETELPLM
jgi:hypothetical protein